MCEAIYKGREEPPELDPATIPDEPAALEPAKMELTAPEEPEPEPVDSPVVRVRGVETYTTSLDVSAYCRKAHKNVLRDIENLNCSEEFHRLNFEPCSYQGDNGKELPAFNITQSGAAFLITGFTGAEAGRFKEAYITEFDRMEAALKGRLDGVRRYGCAEDLLADPHALLKLAVGYAEKIRTLSTENTKLETQVSVLEPKAAALDRLGDKAGTMNLRSAAKALGFGPDFFKRRLEQLDYLFREDGRLVAYQKHIDAGLFTHKPVVLSHRDGTEYVVSQPLVTAKGLARLAVAFGVGVRAVLGQGVLGLRNDDGLSDGEALH